MVAQHARLSGTAQRQQEQRICPNHLVGLHRGQRPWSLHLQRFLPRLLYLANYMQIDVFIQSQNYKHDSVTETEGHILVLITCSNSSLPFPWQLSVFLVGIFPDSDHTPDTRYFLLFHHLRSCPPNHHRSDRYCYSPGLQHNVHSLPQ